MGDGYNHFTSPYFCSTAPPSITPMGESLHDFHTPSCGLRPKIQGPLNESHAVLSDDSSGDSCRRGEACRVDLVLQSTV